MRRLRVGIIGQGRSGYSIHAHLLSILSEQFEIAAVADPLQDRRSEAEEKLGCRSFEDFREMLEAVDMDFVVNAPPSNLHVPFAAEILDRGINVLCDKPLARRVEDVDKLIGIAEKKKVFLAVFQQSRFAPYFQKVREVISSGALGRIVMIKIAFNGFSRRWDWQTLQKYDGGNLLNTGPHPLDQALQLFGTEEEPNVFCVMDRAVTYGDAEDHVKLILTGDISPTIDLEISSCDAYPTSTYEVYGSRGGLRGTTSHIEWKYFDPDEAPKQRLTEEPLPERAYCREDLPWREDSWDLPEEESNLFDIMGTRYYQNLYRFITDGVDPEVTVQQVRRQIAVIEESHRQNPMSRGIA